MSKNERMVGISRRTLVKSTAIGSLALAASRFFLYRFYPAQCSSIGTTGQRKVVWGACSVNCGSRCALHVCMLQDNEVTRVGNDNTRQRRWQPSGTRLFARSLHPPAY